MEWRGCADARLHVRASALTPPPPSVRVAAVAADMLQSTAPLQPAAERGHTAEARTEKTQFEKQRSMIR